MLNAAAPRKKKVRQYIAPLLKHLKNYDNYRIELQNQGGNARAIRQLTSLLNKKFLINSPYETNVMSLTDQQALKKLLNQYDIIFDIRQNRLGMPLYYVCWTYYDYYSNTSLIIDDLYISPDYQFSDERFVKLMYSGHEIWHIRVAPFWDALYEELKKKAIYDAEDRTDAVLTMLGSHILGAAWHSDQMLAVLTARHFGLNHFYQTIELLYLILSGELTQIRNMLDPDILNFFDHIYTNPSVHRFLVSLDTIDGNAISQLPAAALNLYQDLNAAFSRFLTTQVSWGFNHHNIALWKVVFGNYYRLDLVAASLSNNEELNKACSILEQRAKDIIEAVF